MPLQNGMLDVSLIPMKIHERLCKCEIRKNVTSQKEEMQKRMEPVEGSRKENASRSNSRKKIGHFCSLFHPV